MEEYGYDKYGNKVEGYGGFDKYGNADKSAKVDTVKADKADKKTEPAVNPKKPLPAWDLPGVKYMTSKEASDLYATIAKDPSQPSGKSGLSEAGQRFERLARQRGLDFNTWKADLYIAANSNVNIPVESKTISEQTGLPEPYVKAFPQASRAALRTGEPPKPGDLAAGVLTAPLRGAGTAISNLFGAGDYEMEQYKPKPGAGFGETLWMGVAGDPWIPLSGMAGGAVSAVPKIAGGLSALGQAGLKGRMAASALRSGFEGGVSGFGHGLERQTETGAFRPGASLAEAGAASVVGGLIPGGGALLKKTPIPQFVGETLPQWTRGAREWTGEQLAKPVFGERGARAAAKLPVTQATATGDAVTDYAEQLVGNRQNLPLSTFDSKPTEASRWEQHLAQGPEGQVVIDRYNDVATKLSNRYEQVVTGLSGDMGFPTDETLTRELVDAVDGARTKVFDEAETSYAKAYAENKTAIDKVLYGQQQTRSLEGTAMGKVPDASWTPVPHNVRTAPITAHATPTVRTPMLTKLDESLATIEKDIAATPIASQKASLLTLKRDLENMRSFVGDMDVSEDYISRLLPTPITTKDGAVLNREIIQWAYYKSKFDELNRMRALLREHIQDPAVLRSETSSRAIKEMEKQYEGIKDMLIESVKKVDPKLGEKLVEQNKVFATFFSAEEGIGPLLNVHRTNPERAMNVIFKDQRKMDNLLEVLGKLPPETKTLMYNRLKANFIDKVVKVNEAGDILGKTSLSRLDKLGKTAEKLFADAPDQLAEIRKMLELAQRVNAPFMPGSAGAVEFTLSGLKNRMAETTGAPFRRAAEENRRLEATGFQAQGLPRGSLAPVKGGARGYYLSDLAGQDSTRKE